MKYTLLYLFLMVSTICFATKQIPDYLIYNGQTYDWRGSSPGYNYIEKTRLPTPIEAVASTGDEDKLTLTYTIENDSLFLTDVTILIEVPSEISKELPGFNDYDTKSIFSYYFPMQKKIFMNKHTAIHEIRNNEIASERDGHCFDFIYTDYLVFHCKKGILTQLHEVNYENLLRLRHKSFLEFQKRKGYQKFKKTFVENYNHLEDTSCAKKGWDDIIEYCIFNHNIYISA